MQYKTYDVRKDLIQEGEVTEFSFMPIDIPAGGSISVEVFSGLWMNFATSEWMVVCFSHRNPDTDWMEE